MCRGRNRCKYNPVHAVKACSGVQVRRNEFLPTALYLSVQVHTSAAFPRYQLRRILGVSKNQCARFREERIFFQALGFCDRAS